MNLMTRHTELDVRERNSEETLAHFAGGKAGAIPMLPVIPRVGCVTSRGHRWGVILAGGDGMRLRPLTKLICGDDRPKQFCPLFGGRTLLEQTLQRSERTIPREQILVSLMGHHSRWYSREAGLDPSQRVVQPAKKGTAPPILHSLLSLSQLDAQALVAILPCDHHYSDEESFASALECAFETAAGRTDSVVLLGAKPDYPEVEYGWIELGSPLGHKDRELFRVQGFREKPTIDVARRLLGQGSVWNTFVMVGHVQAFLLMVQATLPDLLSTLGSARMWTGKETHIEYSLYERIPSVDFSQRVLSAETDQLVVLRLNEVGWSDLGDPGRAFMAARESGCEPEWIQDWGRLKGVAVEASEIAAAIA
jgi:mannose-1-phosphate guanylyltransferase